MPIYTYRCTSCVKQFDILVGINQEKSSLRCPHCQHDAAERVFTPFRIGSGRSSGPASSKCSSCSGGACSSCGG